MEKIVVGVDGSPHSKAALAFAVEEARLRDAHVYAVHAWEWPPVPAEPLTLAPNDYAALFTAAQEGAERMLENAISEVVGEEREVPRIESAAVEGPAARVLLEAAADALLVVVGSRGRGGFARLLLGSVGDHVVRHAPCPAVIHRTRNHSLAQ
jgi:nucleotide-binding universal stress UspA family protein